VQETAELQMLSQGELFGENAQKNAKKETTQ
jgi:hypothetical protein